jgi:hypothetical protein
MDAHVGIAEMHDMRRDAPTVSMRGRILSFENEMMQAVSKKRICRILNWVHFLETQTGTGISGFSPSSEPQMLSPTVKAQRFSDKSDSLVLVYTWIKINELQGLSLPTYMLRYHPLYKNRSFNVTPKLVEGFCELSNLSEKLICPDGIAAAQCLSVSSLSLAKNC